MSHQPQPFVSRAFARGVRGRCPACGKGALLQGWIRPADVCDICGEDFTVVRAEDGPAWLTILVTGPLVVPLALAAEALVSPPLWLSLLVWPALALGLAAAILPRAKGAFIAMLWNVRRHGA